MPLVERTRTIVAAMRAEGIERYIGMTTPGLRDPRDTGSLLGRLVPFMGRTSLSRAYRELLDMSQLVTDSGLDWTIARFTRPTNGAPTGTILAGHLGRDKIRASITRADIATFLLDQPPDSRFHRAAPTISNCTTLPSRAVGGARLLVSIIGEAGFEPATSCSQTLPGLPDSR